MSKARPNTLEYLPFIEIQIEFKQTVYVLWILGHPEY